MTSIDEVKSNSSTIADPKVTNSSQPETLFCEYKDCKFRFDINVRFDFVYFFPISF